MGQRLLSMRIVHSSIVNKLKPRTLTLVLCILTKMILVVTTSMRKWINHCLQYTYKKLYLIIKYKKTF